jgi:hypothetical protein
VATLDHVAELYAVPPTEFTATRNRLMGELRRAGRTADAKALSRLRKPSPALWAVNRLASTERKDVAAFLEAVDRLRRAQLRGPATAADALRAQRVALQALIDRSRALLERSELKPSPAVLRRIGDTLMGASVDREHATALRRGQLTTELPPPGFEAFGGAGVIGAPLRLVRTREAPVAAATPERRSDSRRPAADERQRRLEAERVEREAAERREREAAERLEREAAERGRSVSQLERESAEARARLAQIDRRLRDARRAARDAAKAAGRARRRRPSR